jgi:uncharacterized membrane protein YbhN (UPF0104 family)
VQPTRRKEALRRLRLRRLRTALLRLPALLGVVLLVGAIYVVQREFRHLRLEDVASALGAIPIRSLAISFGFTVLSYGVLTFYDRLGTIYAGHAVSYARVAFASFCAYALSHNLGFAAVSGAAVRFRLYSHWGLGPLQIGKVVAFCNLTFALGGLVLGGAILLFEPVSVPFFGQHLPPAALRAVGAIMWALVGGYVLLAKLVGSVRLFGHEVQFPQIAMAGVQVLLATVDVGVTAAIFYALLPPVPGLTYVRLLAVYVTSYTAGLAANLPGGIGVFDSAMLLGLSPYLDAAEIVGAILIFRLYYYIIPLFLAGTLFAGNEVLLRGRRLWQRQARRPRLPAVGRWGEPDFAVAAATGAVALCGALLLSLGVLSAPPEISLIDPDFADMAAAAGQFVPSLIGAALLVLAIGLSHRVRLAWGATIVMLLSAAAFTLGEGVNLWIPAVLVLATFVLAPYRGAFYRHARLLAGPLEVSTAVPLLALVICILMLSGFERHVQGISTQSWWAVVLSRHTSNALRFNVAITVLVGLVATWRLIRPGRVIWLPWGDEARLRYAALGADPPAEAEGMVWGEGERAAIPFHRLGRVLLGLGDPAGAGGDQVSAIWRFRDLADQEGMRPAFYRTGRAFLKVYRDLGLTAVPLGPDGLPLPETSKTHASQFLVCRAERDLNFLLRLLPTLAGRQLEPAAAQPA